MNQFLKLMAVAGSMAVLSWAQGRYQERFEERKASLTGGRPDGGKCTIEVNVDDVAEVEIAWDTAKLHTLSGAPAEWRRFICTSPLPPNVADFRYTGIDGRGRQFLAIDPRNNRGLAVIRIEDPRSGREGYTFDIEWRGAAPPPPPPPVGRDDDRYRDRDRGPRLESDRAMAMCQDAVRDRAGRDYGIRDVDFRRVAFDDNPGRRDWVVGTFLARRDRDRDRRDEYSFACAVDFDGRRIGDVQINRR